MPRYRRKPGEITAIQFKASMSFTSIPAMIRNTGFGDWEVWNALHGSWIKFKDGDYIRVDDRNDNYPIDEETFRNSYELINPDGLGGYSGYLPSGPSFVITNKETDDA